jgi:hypothetical protein
MLAVKRHEQPPPGYFESFSDLVITRIEAGENITSQPWWRSLWLTFQTKPVLASAYCLLAAGVSLFTLSMVELATAPAEDQTVLAAGGWPQLNSRAAAELTHRVAFDRLSSTLNPLFSEGTVSDSNAEPPRFLLDGGGWRTRTASFQY